MLQAMYTVVGEHFITWGAISSQKFTVDRTECFVCKGPQETSASTQ